MICHSTIALYKSFYAKEKKMSRRLSVASIFSETSITRPGFKWSSSSPTVSSGLKNDPQVYWDRMNKSGWHIMQQRICTSVLLIDPDAECVVHVQKHYATMLNDLISWRPQGKHAFAQVVNKHWFSLPQLAGCQWVNHWGRIYVHDYLISEAGTP